MAFVVNDRVKETTTSTGTGTINLGGAETGFETFVAGIGNSNTTYYCIQAQGGSAFEIGVGTVTDASPDTLSRTAIISSSNSDAVVDFGAGTKDVFCTLPASKAVIEDNSTNADIAGNLTVGGTVDGVDIAARDAVLTSTTTTANAALPKAGGTMTGQISFGDNVKASFGASDDLEIVHNSTSGNSFISDVGTGSLIISANQALFQSADKSETLMQVNENSDVKLFHDNTERLSTTGSGVDISGSIQVDNGGNLGFGGTNYKIEGSSSANHRIAFHTDGSEAMRLDSSQRLGIGTTSPTEKLDVTGNIAVTGTVDGRDVATDGTKLDGIEASADAVPYTHLTLPTICSV